MYALAKYSCEPSLPRLRKIPSGPVGNSFHTRARDPRAGTRSRDRRRGCGRACNRSRRRRRSRRDALAKSTDSAHASSTTPIAAVALAPRRQARLRPQARRHAGVDRHRASAWPGNRGPPSGYPAAPRSRARSRAAARTAAPSFGRTRRCRSGRRSRAPPRQSARPARGCSISVVDRRAPAPRRPPSARPARRGDRSARRAGRRRRWRRSACPSPAPRTRSAACLPRATGRRRCRAPRAPRRRRA